MIDSQTITDWLTDVTHRPGWRITYGGSVNDRQYLVIRAIGEDTNDPANLFTTAPLFALPDTVTTREQFLDWILDDCIPGIDTHERWEWFRVGGKPWRDPHAPGMPAFATDFV